MSSHAAPHPDLAGFVLGVLDPVEAEGFEAHMASCESCAHEVADLGRLMPFLHDTPPLEPPADLSERTLAAVERVAGPEAPAVPALPAAPPVRRLDTARRRRLGYRLALAAAAVAALAAGGVVVNQLRSPDDARVVEIALRAPDDGAARGDAEVRAVDGGFEVSVSVEGLDPSPSDAFYECWFVGPGDSPERLNRISVGTFTVGPDGTADVAWLSSSVDLDRFPTMGITLEPRDGDPAPGGKKVLAAAPSG